MRCKQWTVDTLVYFQSFILLCMHIYSSSAGWYKVCLDQTLWMTFKSTHLSLSKNHITSLYGQSILALTCKIHTCNTLPYKPSHYCKSIHWLHKLCFSIWWESDTILMHFLIACRSICTIFLRVITKCTHLLTRFHAFHSFQFLNSLF